LISKRKINKYKILNTLKDAELCIEDIEMYSALNRLDIVPLVQDFLRWGDVKVSGQEQYFTKRTRKIYSITDKGLSKLAYIKTKYGFK